MATETTPETLNAGPTEYCPLCDADVPLPRGAEQAACPDCEARFHVNYDMDGPELHWDDEVPQTDKAVRAHQVVLDEEAAYATRMAGIRAAVSRSREAAGKGHAPDVGGYYARCAAEYRALRDLRASKTWTPEELHYLDRAIEMAANTGD